MGGQGRGGANLIRATFLDPRSTPTSYCLVIKERKREQNEKIGKGPITLGKKSSGEV